MGQAFIKYEGGGGNSSNNSGFLIPTIGIPLYGLRRLLKSARST